jgi:hypothetical protein
MAVAGAKGVVWKHRYALEPVRATTYYALWTPKKSGTFELCVEAEDAAGNVSRTSCAAVRVT